MTSLRFVRVAITGPLRRSFIYHLSAEEGDLSPGQRLLVPFGRIRKVGFYLGEVERPEAFETKAVLEILDAESLFSLELFALCTWMADYYFANPADCLSAALPGKYKSRKATQYCWAEDIADDVPSKVRSWFRPGKRLNRVQQREIRTLEPDLFRRLIKESILIEDYHRFESSAGQTLCGYRIADAEECETFFRNRKFQPQPFDDTLSATQLKSAGWTDYYIRLSIKKGLLVPVMQSATDSILDFVVPRNDVSDLKLTNDQTAVLESISSELGRGFKTFLLHGITGSGKTLVYCHLAGKVLALGQSVLVLTPEISLSGTTLAYFRGFFGPSVTTLHSAMTERERLESWRGIRQGKYRIVIGPRSAVFAPLENIGLIIVDEEHDGSYKQDDPAPRFNGRDAAIMRAKLNSIPVVLGSASPSIESYYNAQTGRYRGLTLTQRPGSATLPTVQVVDMRSQHIKAGFPLMSLPLKNKIEDRLKNHEQAILYLNRRGYSPQLKCSDCGHLPKCPHCQVGLTWHKIGRKLSCHYCGHVRFDYNVCEVCGSRNLMFPGAGTQKVEERIPALFREARVVRFDSDTASGRRNAYRILHDFAAGRHNLLLGTQMVTKGLDLSGVSLVGILSADHGLDLPDFRASERTFARLLQVAGRSGRSQRRGEVLIQTFYPDSDVINDAARQDYVSFYEREIKSRHAGYYPPFCRLVNITLSSTIEKKAEGAATMLCEQIRLRTAESGIALRLLGPAPCPMYFMRRQYRWRLLLKTRQVVKFVRMLTLWEAEDARLGLPTAVKVAVDIDPDDMM